MKITHFDIYRYTLPLARPLFIGGEGLRSREGFLVFLRSDAHLTGLGEAAPLPGFSAERLQDVEKQLFYLREKVLNNSVPDEVESLTYRFESWVRTWKLFPSVRCGFETAVLDLLARTRKVPLRQLVDPEAADSVPGTVLVSEAARKALQREASQAAFSGVRSFKMKVGAADINADLERVAAVLEVLPGGCRFHLDANRQWDYGQALNFVKGLGEGVIEYLEEPVGDTEALEEFSRVTSVPVALDETTREWAPARLDGVNSLQAIILKPMLLGGWEKTMGWVRFARERGLRAVISSSFESAVGIRALSHLACAAAPDEAAGLGTSVWYEKDLFSEPFEWRKGLILPGPFDLEKGDLDFNLIRAVNDD